jgi:hypothetical protein
MRTVVHQRAGLVYLDEITTLVHDLAGNIRHIEHLHTQLTENERLTLDYQIYRLRNEIDRELSEFHRIREQMIISSQPETTSSIDGTTNDALNENHDTANELRQRHTTLNRVNDTYDLLEQDLAALRETINEVATLVAHQEEALTRAQQLRNLARHRAHNVSSFFQRAVHNRYVTITSGAVVGALVGGPVGFVMGTKIGALVALTGSAVGALSMNIMQQRAAEAAESTDNTTAYNQAML